MLFLLFKNDCLLLVLFLSLFNSTKSNECSKIYMAPILTEDLWCDEYCFDMYEFLLSDCIGEKINRQFITSLNFFYNNTFTCIMNEENNVCSTQHGLEKREFLNKGQYYGMKNFLFNQIEKDKECGKDALVMFIMNTDSCANIKKYPDIDELFGQGLEQTKNEILGRNVYFLIVLLYHIEESELDTCSDTIKALDFSEDNNIKTVKILAKELNLHTNETCATVPPKFAPKPDDTILNPFPATLVGVSIASSVVLFFIVVFIAFWANQIRRRWKESKIEAFADAHARSARHILFGKYHDEWEVTPKELKVDSGTVLGKGAFGVVYKGFLKKQRNKEWIEMDVAVKFTTEHSTEKMRQDMIEEIGFMKKMGSHENLLVMVGYVKSIDNPVICTVFCSNGDLLGILQKHELHFMSSNPCSNVEICLLLPDLLRLSIEVCNGLCYLSSLNYVHRDIAARNVLLTDQLVAKLGDFGLCKQMELGQDVLIDKEGKFPVKHMPFESIKFGEFSQKFSEKTDVWSYGILIFEMFSGGKKPFDEIDISEFLSHLENDGKPTMPEITPQPMIQLLNEKIFQKYPSRRSTFTEIKQDLLSFYSIVCNVILEEERSSVGSSARSSVRSSMRRRH